MSRRKKVRTTISFLRRPKKCLRRASHFLEFFRFFRGNMIRLRLIPAHLRCQKDAGFLAARKCMCGFVSLQLFSSHLNQSEPHSNHVNTRDHNAGAKLPLLIHQKGTCLLLCRIKWLLVPRLGKAERLSPSLRQNTKAKDCTPETQNPWQQKIVLSLKLKQAICERGTLSGLLSLSSISPKSFRPTRAERLSPSLRRNTKAKTVRQRL